jgi:hypothetical protein
MNAINRVSQKVVCIRDLRGMAMRACHNITWGPEENKVYTVAGFEDWDGTPCIHLIEVPGLRCECATIVDKPWPISCFRPVDERKTDISQFRELLTPITTRELERV